LWQIQFFRATIQIDDKRENSRRIKLRSKHCLLRWRNDSQDCSKTHNVRKPISWTCSSDIIHQGSTPFLPLMCETRNPHGNAQLVARNNSNAVSFFSMRHFRHPRNAGESNSKTQNAIRYILELRSREHTPVGGSRVMHAPVIWRYNDRITPQGNHSLLLEKHMMNEKCSRFSSHTSRPMIVFQRERSAIAKRWLQYALQAGSTRRNWE